MTGQVPDDKEHWQKTVGGRVFDYTSERVPHGGYLHTCRYQTFAKITLHSSHRISKDEIERRLQFTDIEPKK